MPKPHTLHLLGTLALGVSCVAMAATNIHLVRENGLLGERAAQRAASLPAPSAESPKGPDASQSALVDALMKERDAQARRADAAENLAEIRKGSIAILEKQAGMRDEINSMLMARLQAHDNPGLHRLLSPSGESTQPQSPQRE